MGGCQTPLLHKGNLWVMDFETPVESFQVEFHPARP